MKQGFDSPMGYNKKTTGCNLDGNNKKGTKGQKTQGPSVPNAVTHSDVQQDHTRSTGGRRGRSRAVPSSGRAGPSSGHAGRSTGHCAGDQGGARRLPDCATTVLVTSPV